MKHLQLKICSLNCRKKEKRETQPKNEARKELFINYPVFIRSKSNLKIIETLFFFMIMKGSFEKDCFSLLFSHTNRPQDSSQSVRQARKQSNPGRAPAGEWYQTCELSFRAWMTMAPLALEEQPTAAVCRSLQPQSPTWVLKAQTASGGWGGAADPVWATQVAPAHLVQTHPAELWWLRLCFAFRPTSDLNGTTPLVTPALKKKCCCSPV